MMRIAARVSRRILLALVLVSGLAAAQPPPTATPGARVSPPPCQPCFWVDPYQSTHDPGASGIVLDYTGELWQARFRSPRGELVISSEVDPCQLRIQYAFTAAVARARLSVVDSTGRTVRRLEANPAAGNHHAVWDGMDQAGRYTLYGWYRVRLESPGDTLALECVRVRRLPLH